MRSGSLMKISSPTGMIRTLGFKGRLAGWKCLYVPKAVVYHRYSQSSGAYSPLKAFYVERNRVWIAVKYFPLSLLLKSPFFTLLALCLPGVWSLDRPRGRGKIQRGLFSRDSSCEILLKAYLAAFRGLPKMWKKRKEIKRRTRVSEKEIRSWFHRFGISAREISWKD